MTGDGGVEFRNCADCGRLFRYTGRRICLACVDKDEALFVKVRNYLAEHRGAPVAEVSQATEVGITRIVAWLREGRLELTSDDELLTCESCGKPVRTGRFCNGCKTQLHQGLTNTLRSQASSGEEPGRRHDWAHQNVKKEATRRS